MFSTQKYKKHENTMYNINKKYGHYGYYEDTIDNNDGYDVTNNTVKPLI